MDPMLAALVEAGVISLADAERIDRSLSPDAARDYAEGLLQQSFQRGLTAQQARILDVLNDTQGNPTQSQLSRLWAQEDELLWASVGDDIAQMAIDRAVSASIGAIDANTWQLVNENVLEWVDSYYLSADAGDFGSIPNLNITAKTQFAQAFNDWQRGELETAGYNEGLPTLIRSLENTFGVGRAERVAITEVSRVFAQSELFAARANPFIVYLQWLTANDELVCPICGPRADTVVGKEDEDGFRVATDNTVGYPPAHVRCRCSITQLTQPALDALREEGLIAGDAPKVATVEEVANFDTEENAQRWFRDNVVVEPPASLNDAARAKWYQDNINLKDIPLDVQQVLGEEFAAMQVKHGLVKLDSVTATPDKFGGIIRFNTTSFQTSDGDFRLNSININSQFIKSLREEDDMSLNDYFKEAGQSKGGNPRTFVGSDVASAMYHEATHYYHANKLGLDNLLVKELYQKATDSGLLNHISQYAAQDANECFAELATHARLYPNGSEKFMNAIGATDIWEKIKP